MIIYGTSLSPFVRKTMVFAAEKGVAITNVPLGTGSDDPAFLAASPLRKIPAMRDKGADDGADFCIADSSAIVAYIEAKHPQAALIPAEPMARAQAIWFDEFADTVFFAVASKIFGNRVVLPKFRNQPGDQAAADAAEADDLPPLFDHLEGAIRPSGFLVGDALSLADIAIASLFVNLAHASVSVDGARWPKLSAYVDTMLARPSFTPIIAAEKARLAAA